MKKPMAAGEKMKKRLECVFAHAVALDQSSRLKNSVFCIKKKVLIFNHDKTVMLCFPLRESERAFSSPLSFQADSYDSSSFTEEDGRICFTKSSGDYVRKKKCRTPRDTPVEVAKMWKNLLSTTRRSNAIDIGDSIVPLLEEDLSHIEFKGVNKKLIIVQRDIYSGSVLTIERKGGLLEASLERDFPSVGMRTRDFIALFSFTKQVTFYFSNPKKIMCQSKDQTIPFFGSLSLCRYEELGED